MFPIGMALIAVGYALVYYGLSQSKAYRSWKTDYASKYGGVPMPQLLGIPAPYGVTKRADIPFPPREEPGAQPAQETPKKKATGKGKVQSV